MIRGMARVLLLLPSATYRAPDFLAAAGSLGVEVVVASDHRQAMADAMGDRALVVTLTDPEAATAAIEALHRRHPLDAVVAVDDQGVLVAAMAGVALGLPHNPPEAVARTRDKAAMRAALARAGVRQADFRVITGSNVDVAELAAQVGLPCVVKPVALSASRGVIRADTSEEVAAAVARIRAILQDAGEDPAGPLLVERFVAGAEVALEGLLRGGRLEVLALFDKPDPLDGPYFEETIYVTPSRLPASTAMAVEHLVAHAVTAIGLVEGPVHAEVRIDAGRRPWLLEVAARSIGGLCGRSLRFGAGVSLEEVILRHALGLPVDGLLRDASAAGVMMLPIAAGGVLERVGGRAEALAVPGIEGLEISVPVGRAVRPLPEGDRYLGFLFARAATPEQVEGALRQAHDALDVVIAEPAGTVRRPGR
jgi:biotin carboxylase